jgi:murein DD-endopeptidase MepM/ murein hydrolase activator NlpD
MTCSGKAPVSPDGRRKWLAGVFRERQIMVRTAGRITAFRFGRGLQLALCGSALAAAGWTAFASSEYALHEHSLAIRDDKISSARAAYDDALADLDRKRSEAEALARDVARLTELQKSGRSAVQELSDRMEPFVADWKRVIARTGLDAEDLLAAVETGPEASGGPFVPASGEDGTPTPLERDLARFEERLDEAASLRQVISRLPLTVPLDAYAVSSGFGRRRDPINKRTARHEGLDLIAPLNSPIFATAPGVVTYAGRNGRYGNFVEIDHGAGLRTRFGHLAKILVKKGEKVKYRQKIALLGNTGRSTGAHLHYEVRVDGTPRDPMKFIEAGRYVFQNQ